MLKIQESGYAVVSNSTILVWQKCPHCHKLTHNTFPFTVLNADPSCIHCNHFIMGAPLPSTEDRIVVGL